MPLTPFYKTYQLDGADKLRIKLEMPDAASRLRTARGLLTLLDGRTPESHANS